MATTESTISNKGKLFLWIVAIGAAIALIQKVTGTDEQANASTEQNTAAPVTEKHEAGTTTTQFDAYGICCEAAHRRWPNAKFGFEEGVDYGNNDWMIRGHTDFPDGRRVTWTGEVQKDAGAETWTMKGWVASDDNQ